MQKKNSKKKNTSKELKPISFKELEKDLLKNLEKIPSREVKVSKKKEKNPREEKKVINKKTDKKENHPDIKKEITVKSKEDEISPTEIKLVEESLHMIKNLNKEVQRVSTLKTKLQADVDKLKSKVELNNIDVSIQHPKLLLSLKESLIKEFMPILEKFNLKEVKVDIFDEIAKLINLEISKLKTQLDSKTSENKKEINKRFSELETRIIEILINNDQIKKELTNFEKNRINSIEYSLHRKVEKVIKEEISRISDFSLDNSKKIMFIQDEIEKEQRKLKTLTNNLDNLKNEFSINSDDKGHSLYAINNKIINIRKDVKEIQNSLKTNEENINQIKNNYSTNIENEIESNINEFKDKIREIEVLVRGRKLSMDKDFNKLKNDLNKNIENKIKNLDELNKKDLNKIHEEIEEKTSKQILNVSDFLNRSKIQNAEIKRDFFEEIENKYINLKKQFEKSLEEEKNIFNKELKEQESNYLKKITALENEKVSSIEELNKFKEEISLISKDYLSKVDKELEKVNSKENNFKNEEKEFLSKIDKITKAKEEELNDSYELLSKSLKNIIAEERENFQRNENTFRELFLEKITNLEEFQKKKIDNIEKKFLEKNLKIINKYIDIENKKISLIGERIESRALELEKKSQIIDAKEKDFENELEAKQNLIEDNLKKAQQKQSEIIRKSQEFLTREISNELENLNQIVNKEKEKIDSKLQEITIREKKSIEDMDLNVNNLNQRISENIAKLEKKYQTNMSEIRNEENNAYIRISNEEEKIKEFIRVEEELLKNKILEFENSIFQSEKTIKERAEERLTQLEKKLNNRFLDYDSMFSNFKGVVIDEVEDLVKEIGEKFTSKSEEMNKLFAQGKFILNELKTRGFDANKIKEIVEREISDIRDNIEDIKVKHEIFNTGTEDSLTDHINHIKNYEEQLEALVYNLKNRGFNEIQIQNALINKGHPKMYVRLILENLNRI
jgi:hypothetical protein